MLKSLGLLLILFASAFPAALAQNEAAPLPVVTLSLPVDISSANAQINYFMTGPFGGYGKLSRLSSGATTYEIAASVDGKPAINIKIVAYFPGCEIETLELKTLSGTQSQSLTCDPVRTTTVRGHIATDAVLPNQSVEVNVEYLAMWTHDFFGIRDGNVMTIQVAKAHLSQEGDFEIEVPDFSAQSRLGDAAFELTLRDVKTGNLIASLKPQDEARNAYGLAILPDYPQVVQFAANLK